MKLQGLASLIAAWTLAPAFALEGHHQNGAINQGPNHDVIFSNRPRSHTIFHQVENACSADVEKFCQEPQELFRAFSQSMGDPFLDWVFLPSMQPPAELLDLTFIMERMFDPKFLEPSRQQVTIFFMEEPQQIPFFLVDSVAAKVAQEWVPEEIPQLVTDMQDFGRQMIPKFEVGTMEQRMARRLSEVDATTIQHHVYLPFGCRKNRCLREQASAGRVSEGCASSMLQLETTYALEVRAEERYNLVVGTVRTHITFFLVFLMVMILVRMMCSSRNDRVIYSTAELKREVEGKPGHSGAYVPPVLVYSSQLTENKGNGRGQKHVILARHGIYEGVRVQIV